MRMNLIGVATLTVLSLSVQAATAQQVETIGDAESNLQVYAQLLREDVRSEKMTIITEMMQFSPDEAARFWPVYAEYDRELALLSSEKVSLIEDYALRYDSMTDAAAIDLVTRALDLETSLTAVKRRYLEQFSEALSGRSAARFLQIENQLLRLIDLQVASSLPILP